MRRLPGNETGKYILNGHEPVEEPDLMKWGAWMQKADRQVRDTFRDSVRVSTVFLGIDHNFWDWDGPPLLFETMVFINGSGDEMERYSTWDEALRGHENMVNKIFKATPILILPTMEKSE
jgi:hypothetical protein